MPETDPQSALLVSYADALDQAVAEEMRRDPLVYVWGTNPPEGLTSEFGGERVRRMPVSEAMFTGMALGAAAGTVRPIVLWRNVTFGFVAFEQLANQIAKARYMSGGQRAFPILIRCSGGLGEQMAAQHSATPYAIFAQLPGLKVIAPADPVDALGMTKSAIRDPNPVISCESVRLSAVASELPTGEHLTPLGKAIIRHAGSDITIVSVGAALVVCQEALNVLSEDGVSAELIDLRSIVPMDVKTVRESVQKTGRVIVVDEATPACSVAAEVATAVCEDETTFARLRSPIRRICSAPTPVPYSPVLEETVRPAVRDVAEAARSALAAE